MQLEGLHQSQSPSSATPSSGHSCVHGAILGRDTWSKYLGTIPDRNARSMFVTASSVHMTVRDFLFGGSAHINHRHVKA